MAKRISFAQANCLSVIGIAFGFGLVFSAGPLTKRLLAIIAAIGLAGCGSVSFVSQELSPQSTPVAATKVPVKQPVIKLADIPVIATAPVDKPVAVNILKSGVPSGESYNYGRFLVEVSKDGTQKVVGGQFTPAANTPVPATEKCAVFINYSTKELTSYCKNAAGTYVPIVGYAVVTPKPDSLRQALVRGVVTKIDANPSWCPTKSARKLNPNLPRGCLPPGHELNAMGAVKFIIDWELPKMELIRLHGSKGYPLGEFWTADTLGCTRLENTAILELVRLLGKDAVKEGIEVVLLRGSQATEVEFLKKDALRGLLELIGTGR